MSEDNQGSQGDTSVQGEDTMHLAAAHFMYIVRTAMHISYTLHLLLDPRRIFEMGLTLTHLPINPLIEQPKERRREWILTSSLHDQILFTY
jgi:hypothetical protein